MEEVVENLNYHFPLSDEYQPMTSLFYSQGMLRKWLSYLRKPSDIKGLRH